MASQSPALRRSGLKDMAAWRLNIWGVLGTGHVGAAGFLHHGVSNSEVPYV
jgi:nitrate reductase NapE component